MLQSQRHDKIADYLAEHDFMNVKDAVKVLKASPATVRRDFDELARQGVIIRVRGGVKLQRKPSNDMLPFAFREIRHSAEKMAIARHACSLLKSGDVAFVDGGTTTFQLTRYLPDEGLRIITNSLGLATALGERGGGRSDLEVHVTGGFVYPNSWMLLGPQTETSLSQYHAKWAFLSASGVSQSGITNTNALVVEPERIMIRNCENVVLLADHSKIGKYAMCRVCGLDEIDILITDEWPENKPMLDRFTEMGVQVLLVNPGQPQRE